MPQNIKDTSPNDDTDEEEALALALSALAVADRDIITHQEMHTELSSLTDEERAAALADMFGKKCSIGDISTQKRQRKDLDKNDVGFLLRQMRLEIDNIPGSYKTALVEALGKPPRLEENSDKRPEKFLRREGMNVQVSTLLSRVYFIHFLLLSHI